MTGTMHFRISVDNKPAQLDPPSLSLPSLFPRPAPLFFDCANFLVL